MQQCGACGGDISEGSRFCADCGAAQGDQSLTSTIPVVIAAAEVQPPNADVHADLPAGVSALVIERGPDAGTRFLLTSHNGAAVSIGRDANSDIFLDDVTVSRRHATASFDGSAWHIHDVGSLNGTYVNGQRCVEQQLRAGDLVTIGKFRFAVVTGENL